LERLKKENIEGLVIDLRRDGGGSLEESINLSGLFIESGPIVLAKDPSGNITSNIDKNPTIAYTGPMVVVMNRLSASASEIFAAAMQDYGRAVVVGDERSFGKGTVQTVQDLDRSMSLPFFNSNRPPAGAIRLTIQKFYRVSGGSTQLNGVESDIVLPSHTDSPKIGEGAFKNPLGYDEVAPVAFKPSPNVGELFLSKLRERSSGRIAVDPEFLYVSEDMQRFRERLEKNSIVTNLEARRKELADDKSRNEVRKAERLVRGPIIEAKVWQVTLDDVNNNRQDLEVVPYERERDKNYEDSEEVVDGAEPKDKTPEPDPVRNESLRIMADLIEFTSKKKTASASLEANLPVAK
jgi:carboxyl-terminal processing protease